MLNRYKITIAYDGTDFCGWQAQPHDPTISVCMQEVFYKTFGEKISLVGASRTDTGVHALGQVVVFSTKLSLSPERLILAWNEHLPKSILIRSIRIVPESFDVYSNVYQKVYYYHLFLHQPIPFISRYGWYFRFINLVDWNKFSQALSLYIGTHDFSSFCKIRDCEKNPIRTIDRITLTKLSRWNIMRVTVRGRSFLRFQIRRMIGYALDVAWRKDLSVNYLKGVLENPNSQQTLLKAEAAGLCLRKVVYKDDISGG
jgi:tRNA pseudouridine38-40 synthase